MKVFHRFRLDTVNHCLWHGGERLLLAPKAFDVLRYLVEHADRLVTQEEMLEALWPQTYVNPEVVKKYILGIRKVLGDQADRPAFIATIPRRGYRFIAPIHDEAEIPYKGVGSNSTRIGVLGREVELDKMHNWLNKTLDGERQTIFITGEPGIGKTTIVQAFLEQASQVSALVARGQCLEHYGAAEPFLPVLDGFSRMLTSDGTETLDLLRHQAPMWLAQMPSVISQSERDKLQSQVAGSSRERMLREMAGAIESLTTLAPLLLVLEDLHWSDYSTLDLISYLARRGDPARLMIVGTYRPVDVILSDHPLRSVKRELQAHSMCQELPLEYLAEAVITEYLTARFPRNKLPSALRRAIYQRTEGNPLFMVTLLEYLCNERMIVEDHGIWKLRVDLAEVERGVPGNLRQLIEKQIERLSPDERIVLEAASVAGMECTSEAIASGLDKPAEWVEKHCEELARRHQLLSPAWLVELPDGTITSRQRFIHVLYRDVPYRLIAPRLRSQMHQRIAERGERIYGDRKSEIAAELAMHYEQSNDWLRAMEHLLQAAENAAASSAHHEAVDLANRGLEALRMGAQAADCSKQEMKLRVILIASMMAIKGFASPVVEEVNARGRELFWRHGPSHELFYMLWSLNFYQQFSGKMQSSLEVSYQLLQLAEKLKDEVLIMEAHRARGAVLVLLGRCAEALDYFEKGLALAAKHSDKRGRIFFSFENAVMLQSFSAMALLELGYPDQAVEKAAAALAHAREIDHPQTLVVAAHIAAQILQLRGEASRASEYAKEAMEIADQYGLTIWVTYGLIELGWVAAELGNPQDGIEKMERGLADYEKTGAKLRSPYFLGLLADQLGKTGRIEEALLAISKALELAKQTGEGYALPEWHRIKGELFMKSAEAISSLNASSRLAVLSQARICLADAIASAKQQGARMWELRAALSLHRLDAMLGHSNPTRLEGIYSSFTEGFESADLRQARSLIENAVK
jgi:DNA-binding winged helix-turn-helix (wHTH) protein/tetratricopeptide (TPR) repeat protein